MSNTTIFPSTIFADGVKDLYLPSFNFMYALYSVKYCDQVIYFVTMYDYIIKINLTGYFINETNASERFMSNTNTSIRPVINTTQNIYIIYIVRNKIFLQSIHEKRLLKSLVFLLCILKIRQGYLPIPPKETFILGNL